MPEQELLLRTSRLVLRPIEPEDAQGVFDAYASDPEASKYMVFVTHTRVEEASEYIRTAIMQMRAGTAYTWAIVLSETGTLIGVTDLLLTGKSGEIGFAIGRKWWGRGYVPEAAAAVLDFARDQLRLERVVGQCDVENARSARVFEKLGFRALGIYERAVVHPQLGAEPRDARRFQIDL